MILISINICNSLTRREVFLSSFRFDSMSTHALRFTTYCMNTKKVLELKLIMILTTDLNISNDIEVLYYIFIMDFVKHFELRSSYMIRRDPSFVQLPKYLTIASVQNPHKLNLVIPKCSV